MITVDLFQNLGNSLFIIAAAEAIAISNNDSVAIPSWKYAELFNYQLKIDNHIFEYKQKNFNYEQIPYSPKLKIFGYFQSEKYFIHQENYIRKIFTISDKYKVNQIDKCAIHVRRGDYLKLQEYHPVLSMTYYTICINKIIKKNPNQKFIVFSDDPEWCKLNFKSKIFEISEANEIDDFCRMTACTKHIIANSSFSWWTAWLANGEVYAPNHKKWFGPSYYYHNTSDLIPERWIQIDF